MKEDQKYKNIEALVHKHLLSSPVGEIFCEIGRESGSCYAAITYASPDLVLRAHDDKGIPYIQVSKSDHPSSFLYLHDIYRDLNSDSGNHDHTEISELLRFLAEDYKLICNYLVSSSEGG